MNLTQITLLIIGVIIAIFVLIKWVRDTGLENIRGEVYQLFLKAEHNFQHGENKEKFEYVIAAAKEMIPMPYSLFITETLLRSVTQTWFDLVKDLLDDGKLNNTSTK